MIANNLEHYNIDWKINYETPKHQHKRRRAQTMSLKEDEDKKRQAQRDGSKRRLESMGYPNPT